MTTKKRQFIKFKNKKEKNIKDQENDNAWSRFKDDNQENQK